MNEPDAAPSLAPPRQAVVALLALTTIITVAVSMHDGAIARAWTNALGALLGALAGTYIGEGLARFGERSAATGIAWLLMAAIGLVVVAIVSWQALPAYCQLPVSFVMGTVIVAAAVFLQRLRFGGEP